LLAAILIVSAIALAQTAPPPPDLDAYVAAAMKTFDVPGMASLS